MEIKQDSINDWHFTLLYVNYILVLIKTHKSRICLLNSVSALRTFFILLISFFIILVICLVLSFLSYIALACRQVDGKRQQNRQIRDSSFLLTTSLQRSMSVRQREGTTMRNCVSRAVRVEVIGSNVGWYVKPRLEAGSKTSTVSLRVVGSDEKESQCLGV
jgi:predicted membrane protein